MPEFNYVARDTAGAKVSGALSAVTERDAVAMLTGRSLFPVELIPEAPLADVTRIRRIPAQLRATTYSQLSDLLQSGVPLLRAMAVLKKQTTHKGLVEVLQQVHQRVEDGATLADAMGRFPRVFGEMPISMIRAGEEGGFLEEALQRVAQFTESQDDLTKRTAGALVYPLFLAVVGTVVVSVLMIFFVPMFDELFEGLREQGELPMFTEWLLALSRFLQAWVLPTFTMVGMAVWLGKVGLLATVIWLAVRWLRTEQGRWTQDRLKIRLPLVGKVLLSLTVARFCRVLGTLLANGVPIVRSLKISASAAGNRVLGKAIEEASENISAGERLSDPLAACGHFPPAIIEMIAVAEESNTLETVLINVADSLERRTWRELDIVVRLLEPIMLLMLAGVVLMLVIALLLPIIKMSMAVG